MNIAAVVQARMSSSRCPGKVLRSVHGKPLLLYVLERVSRARSLDDVLVATSTDPSDNAIATFCRDVGVDCIRGPLTDVAARFTKVCDTRPIDAFVRVCADSPTLDQSVVEAAVGRYRDRDVDVVTNVFPRTFPPGQSVEVVSVRAFRRALDLMSGPDEREHLTKVLYRKSDKFRIVNVEAPRRYEDLRLTVDDEDDLAVFSSLIGSMTRAHWAYSLDEIAALSRSSRERA